MANGIRNGTDRKRTRGKTDLNRYRESSIVHRLFSLKSIGRSRLFRGFTQLEILVVVFIIGIMAAIAAPSLGGMLEAARMKQATVELRSAFQETQRQSIRSNQACAARVFIPSEPVQGSIIQGNCLSSGDRQLPQGIGLATNVQPEASLSGSLDSRFTLSFPYSEKIHRAAAANMTCQFSGSQCNSSSETSDNSDSGVNDSADDDSGINNSDDDNSGVNDSDDERSQSSDNEPSSSNQSTKAVEVGFGPLGSADFKISTQTGSSSAEAHSAKFISFRPNKLEAPKTCVVLSRSLGLTRIGTYQGALDPIKITTQGKCQVANWKDQ